MKIFFLLIIVTLRLVMAENLSSDQLKTRQMIKEIQKASDTNRFEKMNAFKKHLRKMKTQERKAAILKLQNSLVKKGLNEDSRKKERIRTQTQLHESQKQLQMQHQMQNQIQHNGSDRQMMKKP